MAWAADMDPGWAAITWVKEERRPSHGDDPELGPRPGTPMSLKPTTICYKIYRQPFLTRLLSTHASPHAVDNDLVIVGGGPAGLALASALGELVHLINHPSC